MNEVEDRTTGKEVDITEPRRQTKKIAFFGHFDSTNFGNESTLQAILYNLRRFQPDAEVLCISTGPEAAAATHQVKAIPMVERFIESWAPRNRPGRMLRRVCIALPAEAYRCVKGLISLRRTDMLIVPGTGLLTDAYGFSGWGPYTVLRWSLIAKLCRCKLLLVSVGAGPIYSARGRWFVKAILSLADFRSYRDNSTLQCLLRIGFHAGNDRLSPDLAFSLPEPAMPGRAAGKSPRAVVGLGVMEYAGKYSVADPTDKIYSGYLDSLAMFAEWLLARGYDVRLLIGDLGDIPAKKELRDRISERHEQHLIDEPIRSVEDLLAQIAETDLVVATRFHNVLLSLVCNKPVLSIVFHHKCESLMSAMGLSEYCVDINDLKADQLIERFCDLQRNSDKIKWSVRAKTSQFRAALDQQYRLIFDEMLSS